ncbi:response regulator [Crocosphaera sp. UHCC 0190]|uniref:response regulator n=1 Tax=Crocosphaera sp. UHCC 0190 TaxID=3110246 RepID=UPI002B21BFA9|nr:response regulator [Crocosphaera sp. UHCC 0190]MEA5510570.1 response regulator [Crocosphaera sp. UHCC 0190]
MSTVITHHLVVNSLSLPPEVPLILVVDDDRAMRSLLRVAMEEEGYRVIEAKNGQQCLDEYDRRQVDMVLLDAIMPEMDGFTCCQRLRSLDNNVDLPILMITALDDQESIDQAFAVGATDYITKPISWSVLSQRVSRLLQTSQALKQLNSLKSRLEKRQKWQVLENYLVSQGEQPISMKTLLKDVINQLQSLVNAERVGMYQNDGILLAETMRPGYPSVKTLSWEKMTLWETHQNTYQQGKIVNLDFSGDTELSPEAIAPFKQLMIQTVTMMPILVKENLWLLVWIHHCQSSYLWEPWEIDCLAYLGKLLAIAYRLRTAT